MVAAMDTMLLPGADPLRVSAACEAVIAWACPATGSHPRSRRTVTRFFDNTGVLVEPAAAEIGCALHWSAGAASRRVDLAATICTDLPELLTALRDGRLDLAKAEEITRGPLSWS